MHRRILLCLALSVLFTSCGTFKFNRAWSSYEPTPDAGALEGRWKGEWKSDMNGHSGGLRCIMTPLEEPLFDAWFHSTYGWIFTFTYSTELTVTEEAGTFHFHGEQDLGKTAGGLYRYEGTVTGDAFQATFEAENGDHGVFEMTRVAEE